MYPATLLSANDASAFGKELNHKANGQGSKDNGDVTYSLVAFPAKDNYEGRLYPLEWIQKVGWGWEGGVWRSLEGLGG
jgi:hypothetical protein